MDTFGGHSVLAENSRTTFGALSVSAGCQGCSLGLERLGLETVSRHFFERLGLVSIPSLQSLGLGLDARTSRSHLGLETLTSRSHLGFLRLVYIELQSSN